MIFPVSVNEKKNFIYWFLNQYEMKKIESSWILTYLANHHDTLQRVHFVREVRHCPRGLIISSNCSDTVPFRFYRNHIVTVDADKAFHDIRLNPFETLYVQLYFDEWKKNPQYAGVLEENPFLSDDYYITSEDREQTENFIHYSLDMMRRKELVKKIDQALDKRNQDEFIKLSQEIYEIDQRLNSQFIY